MWVSCLWMHYLKAIARRAFWDTVGINLYRSLFDRTAHHFVKFLGDWKEQRNPCYEIVDVLFFYNC